jgi:hypothetical protein
MMLAAHGFVTEYSAPPLAFSKLNLERIVLVCIFFWADLFREFRVYQRRDFALEFLVPGSVFTLCQDDLFDGELREIFGPYWHNLQIVRNIVER